MFDVIHRDSNLIWEKSECTVNTVYTNKYFYMNPVITKIGKLLENVLCGFAVSVSTSIVQIYIPNKH